MRIIFLLCFLLGSVVTNGQGKNLIGGLRGTDSLSLTRVWATSLVVPGYAQAYNRQYWKIPTLYVGAASMIYAGSWHQKRYNSTGDNSHFQQMRLYYAGAGLLYVGSVIDGLLNYKTDVKIYPRKATFLSMMVPGVGQAYNGDYWKIPLIYSGFSFLYYWKDLNSMQYNRYRAAYNEETAYLKDNTLSPSEFHGRLGVEGIKNRRDAFRRDRDYAVLYMVLWYGLNVIDANVWAHLSNFDVSDQLAFKLSPNLTLPTRYAETPTIGFTLTMKMK